MLIADHKIIHKFMRKEIPLIISRKNAGKIYEDN